MAYVDSEPKFPLFLMKSRTKTSPGHKEWLEHYQEKRKKSGKPMHEEVHEQVKQMAIPFKGPKGGRYNPEWESHRSKAIEMGKKHGPDSPEAKEARKTFYMRGGKPEHLVENEPEKKPEEKAGELKDAKTKVENHERLVAYVDKRVKSAGKREGNDDHLDDDERKSLVEDYKKAYPGEKLPEDMTDAYVYIVLG